MQYSAVPISNSLPIGFSHLLDHKSFSTETSKYYENKFAKLLTVDVSKANKHQKDYDKHGKRKKLIQSGSIISTVNS